MIHIFKPKAHIERLANDKISSTYTRLRWQLFLGIFFGYAGYYLSTLKICILAMPYLIEEGFSSWTIGRSTFAAVSIAYGLSKFLMGSVSDRSNPRYFLTVGLVMLVINHVVFWIYADGQQAA